MKSHFTMGSHYCWSAHTAMFRVQLLEEKYWNHSQSSSWALWYDFWWSCYHNQHSPNIVLFCYSLMSNILWSDFIMRSFSPSIVSGIFPHGANATRNPFGHLLNPPSRFLLSIVCPLERWTLSSRRDATSPHWGKMQNLKGFFVILVLIFWS